MAGFSDEERQEFLEMSGAKESGLEGVISKGYRLLKLISFFSMNENEVRAWTIQDGWTAPRAAGVIHTDFERGFIKAEVTPFEIFVRYGSWSAAKGAGAMGIQGKDYIVKDGDVILFRFNL
jgi:ribosome-binding ATPase YchF (GTP1/OBG family)